MLPPPPLLLLLLHLLIQLHTGSSSTDATERSGVRILRNQTFSKTLFILWDIRILSEPEFNETTTVRLQWDSGNQLKVDFTAFKRHWLLSVATNNFLLPEPLPTELRRASDGAPLDQRLSSIWRPLRDRLFLGTADAGSMEQGWAAVTLLGDGIRAYIVTNINDYMLNVPIANQSALLSLEVRRRTGMRSNSTLREAGEMGWFDLSGDIKRQAGGDIKRQAGGDIKRQAGGDIKRQAGGDIKRQAGGDIKLQAGGDNGQPSGGINGQAGDIISNVSRPDRPNPHLPKSTDFVNLGPLPRASRGREIYAEFGVILDETWLDSLTLGYGIDRDSALALTAELLHYAQVWYLHPSLGYRLWLRVSYVTVLNGSRPMHKQESFEQFCHWQARLRRDIESDFVLILTGDRRHCNGLGGVAFPSEACNSQLKSRQCACVYHQRLQANTLIRAIAHEIGHLIGMPDDYAGRSSQLCYSGLMRYGLYEDSGWSTCAVQNLERFLFIRGNTCLHRSETPGLAQSQPPPQLLLNTAWRAPAWQSSTADDDEAVWGAWKATDGHIFGVPHENTFGDTENLLGHLSSCSQTKSEARPWLVVQLDSQAVNSSLLVHVYGREECCEHTLNDLTVGVGDQRLPHQHTVCRTFESNAHAGKYKLLSVKCLTAGSFLSIRSTSGTNTSLSVCEVYVFQDKPPEPFSHAGETCFDEARYCDEWKVAGDCSTASHVSCMRTCGLCEPAGQRVVPRPRFRGQPQAPLPPPQRCRDGHRYCRYFAANGLCEEKWSHCPLACGRCGAASTSASATAAATSAATIATVAAPMATSPIAPTAAAMATRQTICIDTDPNCWHWAGALYCQYRHIADGHCRKSCGTC